MEYTLKSLCEKDTKLGKLGTLLRRISKIEKKAKQAADQSYKAIGKQDTEQSSSASFCNRVNEKIYRLARTKKVSIIPSDKESNSILDDLGMGSFGAGCRPTSGTHIHVQIYNACMYCMFESRGLQSV